MGVKREKKILKASVLNLNKILKCTLLIVVADPDPCFFYPLDPNPG